MSSGLEIHTEIKSQLSQYISTDKVPNLLIYGKYGSGKKTLVKWFTNEIYKNINQNGKILFVNCSLGKGIKFIREDLKHFARTTVNTDKYVKHNSGDEDGNQSETETRNVFKIIILSNADKLTIDAQSALRRCIEIYSFNTRFILIVENKKQIMNPILSRFCEIYIPVPTIKGQYINLYKKELHNAFPNIDDNIFIQKLSNKFYTYIAKFKDFKTFDNNSFFTLNNFKTKSIHFYNKGFSGNDLIEAIKLRFYTTTCFHSRKKEINFVICFNKIRTELRCEKLLLFILIYLYYTSFILNKFIDIQDMALFT